MESLIQQLIYGLEDSFEVIFKPIYLLIAFHHWNNIDVDFFLVLKVFHEVVCGCGIDGILQFVGQNFLLFQAFYDSSFVVGTVPELL